MANDFDVVVNRRGTNSEKWDNTEQLFGSNDVLPMWVADMDFLSPVPVIEAVRKRAEHGVYGYTFRPDSLYESIINWVKTRHGWDIKREWISFTPGVVPAINLAVMAFTNPGDGIIIQTPVYHPFFDAVEKNGRRLVENRLKVENGRYVMDVDSLERSIDSSVKMLILCSPHNPVGRVWEREEFKRVGEICLKNNIIIVSDEIHSDIVYGNSKHIPAASVSDELGDITITCMAPSKTFNIAGLSSSFVVIPNKKLRDGFESMAGRIGMESGNLFGITAMEAAYSEGRDWLDGLLKYLEGNANYVVDYLEERIPKIRVIKPQATYLAWLDFREYNLTQKDLNGLLCKSGVGLSSGTAFGRAGEGFMRLNFGCPRPILEEGMKRIESAAASI
jgi:Bifunctional PLP-dependent enzyme with beta-cystathionase and maltose regulon repressor activities